MKAKLIYKLPGAIYQGATWDFWVFFELENTQVIKVFDSECLTEFLDCDLVYEISLSTLFLDDSIDFDSKIFKGKIISTADKELHFNNKYFTIELRDSSNISKDKEYYSIGRIDLNKIQLT